MLEDLNGDYLRACRNVFGSWPGGRADSTLLLGRTAISKLMSPAAWLDAAAEGFGALGAGRASSPMPITLQGGSGAFHAKAASLVLDRHYVALKLNGNFPDNRANQGLPTIQGAILLCDGDNGCVLAILDSIEVTLRRTAAATALAARHLARPDADTFLICGCGDQAAPQLEALRGVLPLRKGYCWDQDHDRAEALARHEGLTAVDDLAQAARLSDVIVTCTTATEPFLRCGLVRPGVFIAAVGADSPEKSEIEPALMARALVVCDVVEQCLVMGDLQHAIAAGAMKTVDVHAALSDLVAGITPGRSTAEQITLFDSTGTAVQDAAAAVAIYRKAIDAGGCRTVNLAA